MVVVRHHAPGGDLDVVSLRCYGKQGLESVRLALVAEGVLTPKTPGFVRGTSHQPTESSVDDPSPASTWFGGKITTSIPGCLARLRDGDGEPDCRLVDSTPTLVDLDLRQQAHEPDFAPRISIPSRCVPALEAVGEYQHHRVEVRLNSFVTELRFEDRDLVDAAQPGAFAHRVVTNADLDVA